MCCCVYLNNQEYITPTGLRPALRICTCLYQCIFTLYTNITMALSTYLVYPHKCAPVSITVSVISTHIYTCLYSRISTWICPCLYHCIFTIRTNIPCLNQRIFNIHTKMHLSVPTYGFCPHEYAPVCTHVWFLSTWICTCLYKMYLYYPHICALVCTHICFLSTRISNISINIFPVHMVMHLSL